MRIGKYKLITFRGLGHLEVKRKAIAYWYDHRHSLALSLRDFLARCQPTQDGTPSLYFNTF